MGVLDGRVAIVTGGARGIGRAYCLGLARAGAAVVSADLADSTETVEAVEAAGGKAGQVQTDVSDQDSTERMARFTAERFGTIHILVNNAGYFVSLKRGPWYDIPVDEWDKAFAINTRGVWLCSRAVWPYMRAQGYGKIINITSNVVYRGVPNFLHYSASKSALIGLTRSLACEVGEHGIAVNAVAPEYIPSSPELEKLSPPDQDERVVQQRIFKRTQTPEDMVGTIVFLSSSASDFITGQSILVNGGSCFV